MTTTETLKLALEALEYIEHNYMSLPAPAEKAITALRVALASQGEALASEAIEQPAQQEPVAWICEGSSSDEKHAIDYWPGDIEDIPIGTKLYTSPPTEATPLAQRQARSADTWVNATTWRGLTDEEISKIPAWIYSPDQDGMTAEEGLEVFARAIEAKLKAKNSL